MDAPHAAQVLLDLCRKNFNLSPARAQKKNAFLFKGIKADLTKEEKHNASKAANRRGKPVGHSG